MANNNIVSSGDPSYSIGSLSTFPESIDTTDTLFTAVNQGQTRLSAPISFESVFLPVKSTEGFPSSGLVVIDQEIIYYGNKNNKVFTDLIRGFGGRRSPHDSGADVKASVCSDHHNAIRDALLNLESYIGLEKDASTLETLYGRLKALEEKFLPNKAIFLASKMKAQPDEVISFQDRSTGSIATWRWDFGDGTSSLERNPVHSYQPTEDGSSATYSVTLTTVDVNGSTSVCTKNDYITIGEPEILIHTNGTVKELINGIATVIFTDQTQGFPTLRKWSFGDGSEYTTEDPAENTVTHNYKEKGIYAVTLVVEALGGRAIGPRETRLSRSSLEIRVV